MTIAGAGTLRFRLLKFSLGLIGLAGLGLAGLSWYFTAPLEPSSPEPATEVARRATGTDGKAAEPTSPATTQDRMPDWPEDRLEGRAAKERLLTILEAVDRWFSRIPAYSLVFHKQERIKGRLLPEQTYFVKVRQDPFAIYLRCLEPARGRELIYAEGHYDNHVIGHPVGLSRLLVPRLKVPPDHPLILAESRYPLNHAGLGNLVRKMIRVRKLDLDEPETVTVLDRTTTPDGRPWLRSRHQHTRHLPERPFAETVILYDPDSRLPLRFTGYDFPEQGRQEKPLGERYVYEDLNLDASFTARDFDPANPDYAFHRL